MNIHKNKNKNTHTHKYQKTQATVLSVKCRLQQTNELHFTISKFIHNISNYVENDKLEGKGEVRGIVEQIFFFFTKRDLMPPPKNRGSMNRSATPPTI